MVPRLTSHNFLSLPTPYSCLKSLNPPYVCVKNESPDKRYTKINEGVELLVFISCLFFLF
jgi:hypothetical protein